MFMVRGPAYMLASSKYLIYQVCLYKIPSFFHLSTSEVTFLRDIINDLL